MADMKLTPEQAQVVTNRGGPLLVSAAAGSGKTFVLVKRLLDRIELGGEGLDEFLIITFTKAAAAELRGRILAELGRRCAASPGDGRLRRQLALVHRAEISTVDAWCSALLRRWAWALDISPDFRQLDEDESAALRERVLDALLSERYAEGGADFLFLADTVGSGRDDRALAQAVLALYRSTESLAEPEKWFSEKKAQALAAGGLTDNGDEPASEPPLESIPEPLETVWGRSWAASCAELLAGRLEEMALALAAMARFPDIDEKYGPLFEAELEAGKAALDALEQGWDQAAQALGSITFGRLPALRGWPEKERFKAVRSRYKSFCQELAGQFACPSETIRRDMAASGRAVAALLDLTAAFCDRFSREKLRRGVMDFADIERRALELLESPRWGGEIASRYREVMVDEYQDINRLQERLFTALSEGGRRLFMVGDVKQSIYGFRLATPEVFLEKYAAFQPCETALPGQGRKIDLNLNFRSRGRVLEAANHFFSVAMSPRLGGVEYDRRQALYQGASFEGSDPAVEAVFIDGPGRGAEQEEKAAALEARWAAGRVRRLIDEEGYAPGDIAILLRSPSGRAGAFRQALEEQGVECSAPPDGGLFQRPEISAFISVLEAIDNPTRDAHLAAAMLSPLWGFTPARLAELRAGCREGGLIDAVRAGGSPDCDEFLRQLDELRSDSRCLPADALVWKLLDEKGLLLTLGRRGPKARENLLSVCALAEKARAQGHVTLYSFLTQLRAAMENGRGAAESERPGAVRIMSIHKSKGLEFPAVLVCGLGARFNRRDLDAPVLFHRELGVGVKLCHPETLARKNSLPRLAIRQRLQRQSDSEELRILYVAMTRAREKLILSAAPESLDSVIARAGGGFLPPNFAMLSGASTPAVWLAAAALARSEGRRALAGIDAPPDEPSAGPRWDISLLTPEDILPSSPGAAEDSEREAMEAASGGFSPQVDGADAAFYGTGPAPGKTAGGNATPSRACGHGAGTAPGGAAGGSGAPGGAESGSGAPSQACGHGAGTAVVCGNMERAGAGDGPEAAIIGSLIAGENAVDAAGGHGEETSPGKTAGANGAPSQACGHGADAAVLCGTTGQAGAGDGPEAAIISSLIADENAVGGAGGHGAGTAPGGFSPQGDGAPAGSYDAAPGPEAALYSAAPEPGSIAAPVPDAPAPVAGNSPECGNAPEAGRVAAAGSTPGAASAPGAARPSESGAARDAAEIPGPEPEEYFENSLRWRYPHAPASVTASKLTPSGLEEREDGGTRAAVYGEYTVESGECPPKNGEKSPEIPLWRPPAFLTPTGLTAAQRGTALHAVMQYIDLNCHGPEAVKAEIARLEEREFITPEQARSADPAKILAFLRSPLGRRAAAGAAVREFKFSVLLDAERWFPRVKGEEILLQGMIDLFFREPGGLVIVDFKTDRVAPGGEAAAAEKYRPQLDAYAAALEAAAGGKVTERQLYFFSTATAVQL